MIVASSIAAQRTVQGFSRNRETRCASLARKIASGSPFTNGGNSRSPVPDQSAGAWSSAAAPA